MTRFIRLANVPLEQKHDALRSEIEAPTEKSVELDPSTFKRIPGSPFAYWVSDGIKQAFSRNEQFNRGDRFAASGGKTLDDFRFVRAWWEIDVHNGWVPYSKGGSFSTFYDDVYLCIDWKQEAAALKAFLVEYRSSRGWSPHWTAELHGSDHYFRAGITWPRRPHLRGSFRALPAGCVFGSDGPAAFADELLPLLALTNSSAFLYLINTLMARGSEGGQTLKYEIGYVVSVPLPEIHAHQGVELSNLARRAWGARRAMDLAAETSHAFLAPRVVLTALGVLDDAAAEKILRVAQSQIDERALIAYGFGDDERSEIESWSRSVGAGGSRSAAQDYLESAGSDSEAEDSKQDADVTLEEGASNSTVCSLSWATGVAFGRFDPRLATGERAIPPEPEPFDPLPSRSPGMYPEGEEPADRPDILVDDEGHPKDLTAYVQRWAEHVGVEVPAELRAWLAREFFPLHIKMYSKSRRKAPIYWQLATPSASYSVWLYIHAFTKDTLFRVQNDYVAGKLAHEERQLETLRAEAGPDPLTVQRKAIETQEAFVEELRAFLDEVKRVASLWNPNLDDGVIINFAPLWRLVPHHKPWQKELKSTWDALCAGKYDWAHLAMHLWPERVVPKCAEDRSLAIAHDLEDAFWYQDENEKWKPREKPTRPIDAVVTERTSSAVKAALKSLMEAPEQSGSARRSRGRRT